MTVINIYTVNWFKLIYIVNIQTRAFVFGEYELQFIIKHVKGRSVIMRNFRILFTVYKHVPSNKISIIPSSAQ